MPEFDWTLPYSSRRAPVLARNVVATSQPLAAQAGLRMLLKGGNAVDAAIATAIALTILEPVSNGLGSDLFALVWDGESLHGLNASGRAPAAWSSQRFAGRQQMPITGWDTVTIPGAVSGWMELSERFGKLPFDALFEPALAYARDGFRVPPTIAAQWARQADKFRNVPGFAEHFLPRGRAPEPGERFASPDMATSLEKIAATRGEAFYRGDLAQAMVDHSEAHGGAHTLADYAAHRCDWVEPLSFDYRGYTVHELPPNGQGIAALMALGILENFELHAIPVDSIASYHIQIEAMKLAFADCYRYVADPQAMTLTSADLLNRSYLATRAKLIDRDRAQPFSFGLPRGGTVYLTAADASGMMVSLIQSNYMGFGSGVVVPGTGISLHNRGAGFSLTPGHPNLVDGGKRPFHSIIPGFLTRQGKPVLSFGVMGGHMQPQGHVQALVRLIDYHQNPQALLDAPRWKVDARQNEVTLDLEPAVPPHVREALVAMGHVIGGEMDTYMDFGAGQFIYRLGDEYLAASDPRRDGQAVGF
jgi:gamma-glutamyltranspeptidase/glutathione hydrolase